MKRGYAAQLGERLKFLSPQQAAGDYGIFVTGRWPAVPHISQEGFKLPYHPRCKQQGIAS